MSHPPSMDHVVLQSIPPHLPHPPQPIQACLDQCPTMAVSP